MSEQHSADEAHSAASRRQKRANEDFASALRDFTTEAEGLSVKIESLRALS